MATVNREYRLQFRLEGEEYQWDLMSLEQIREEIKRLSGTPGYSDFRILYRDVPDWQALLESEIEDAGR